MSVGAANTTASQVVQLLSGLDVSVMQAHQGLRNAVLDLIERSGTGFRKEVTTRLKARKRKRSRKSKDNSGQDEAEIARYLAEQAYSGPANGVRMMAHLTKALNGLRSSLATPLDMYRASANEEAANSLGGAPVLRSTASRQKKVMQQFRTCERKTNVTEGLRRLWLLRVIYEVDRLLLTTERGRTDKSDVAAAEREFSRLSGESPDAIRDLRNVGSSYLIVANQENGLGILLMLGCQTRDIWEHRLKEEAIKWLWKFCEARDSQVTDRAKALQLIACKLVLQGFSDHDTHPSELRLEGHVFSRHFKASEVSQESPAGLQALVAAADVAAADQMHTNNFGSASNTPPRHNTMDDARFQHQFPGNAIDMAEIEQQGLGPPLLPQWQSASGSSWSRGTEAANFPFDNALNPPLHQFDQAGMISAGDTAVSADQIAWEYVPWERW
ncbi:hypothetical protein Q7P37_009862 [Cladosporium fusiforme]